MREWKSNTSDVWSRREGVGQFYSLIFISTHSIHSVTVLLRHFRIKIFAVSCLLAFIYADIDKTIWICKQMILMCACARARTRMQFENGYVNRFCCRLFAAYFLQMDLLHFCNVTLFLRAGTVDSLFLRQSIRSVQIACVCVFFHVWVCLLNCCMFARKLKCNDIYYIFTYHSIHSIRSSENIHTHTHSLAAAYANIIARFYFLSVMEINMLQPKRWLNALEMLVNCTIISHIMLYIRINVATNPRKRKK